MTLAIILITAFVLVGAWLIVYGKKRKRLVTDLAHRRGLPHRDKDDGSMEKELDRAFGLKTPYVRGFSRVRDIISDKEVTMFRVSELIDLNTHAKAQNTSFGRIAAYFDIPEGTEVIFNADGDLKFRALYPPGYKIETDGRFPAIKGVVGQYPPPYTMTATLMRGKALMYLHPVITGGEKPADVEYLYELAKKLKVALAQEA